MIAGHEHRFVEHGGEVEAELSAATETGILAAGLDAFAELVASDGDGEPAEFEVALGETELPLLLVDWLNELLFLAETEGFVPREIATIDLDEGGLRAIVSGRRGAPRPLVKAVSLHGLRFELEGGTWHGRVVFDV